MIDKSGIRDNAKCGDGKPKATILKALKQKYYSFASDRGRDFLPERNPEILLSCFQKFQPSGYHF
jgi:hypothetical protein